MTRLTAKTVLIGLVLGLIVAPLVSAQSEELQKLPRVGPAIAQRILDYRKENGNFKRVEDLMKVRGIGEKVFAQLKDLITVGAEAGGK
jgi:competence protein ComEA